MAKKQTIKVASPTREFVDGKTKQKLPDPNPVLTPQEVRDFYANQYPHLINAKVEGPEVMKSKLKYTFTTSVGTKG